MWDVLSIQLLEISDFVDIIPTRTSSRTFKMSFIEFIEIVSIIVFILNFEILLCPNKDEFICIETYVLSDGLNLKIIKKFNKENRS